MKNSMKILVLILGALLLTPRTGTAQPEGNGGCLRCHGMPNLSYRDEKSGGLVKLAVNPAAFAASEHGKLTCAKCHEGEYQEYPHEEGTPAPTCVTCHKDEPRFKKYRFDKITHQFEKSIHAQLPGVAFDCFSCHDPHTLTSTSQAPDTATLVRRSNAPCLECHGPEGVALRGADPTKASLAERHHWLPKLELHWAAVRCVDCHTPDAGTSLHAINRADASRRECTTCHAQDSLLLGKLYRHKVLTQREQAGFVNSVALNDAYIIGMTRNRILDGFGLLAMGGTLVGVLAHGLGRFIASRRRRS